MIVIVVIIIIIIIIIDLLTTRSDAQLASLRIFLWLMHNQFAVVQFHVISCSLPRVTYANHRVQSGYVVCEHRFEPWHFRHEAGMSVS